MSYSGERSEPREDASLLARLSRVQFSRYPPNGELARRLIKDQSIFTWVINISFLITFPLVFDLILLGLNCCINEVKVKLRQFFPYSCDSTKIYRFFLLSLP